MDKPNNNPLPDVANLFTMKNGKRFFRGLEAEQRAIQIGVQRIEIVRLRDAADLLDEPDFAKQFVENDRAPYGLELWPSASMLARHIEESPPGAGRSALDLGCGLGLVSIVAAIRGWQVVAADNEPTTLRFARFNAELNKVSIAAFELSDWHSPNPQQRFDRIFAADVLYQRVDQKPILGCIKALLAPNGEAVIADPNRGVADQFKHLAESEGFDVNVKTIAANPTAGNKPGGRMFFIRPQLDR